jgi:hypothetical protein
MNVLQTDKNMLIRAIPFYRECFSEIDSRRSFLLDWNTKERRMRLTFLVFVSLSDENNNNIF